MDPKFVQLHLDDENTTSTQEVGATGGIVPKSIKSKTGPKEMTCKKRQHQGYQSKERRQLKRQLSSRIASGHVVPEVIHPSTEVMQASSKKRQHSGKQCEERRKLQRQLSSLNLTDDVPPNGVPLVPDQPGLGSGTSGTSSLAPPTSYKKL